MAAKTKAELLEELELKNAEMKKLKDDLKRLEKYQEYEKLANEFGVMRDAFVNAGFTKAEAFTMVMKTMELATNPVFMATIK